MIRTICLAVAVLAARAVDPPLPYIDTIQDNLMAKAGDVTIMAGNNGIMMKDDGLTFKLGDTSTTLSSIKQAVMDAGDSREATTNDANDNVPTLKDAFDSSITTLSNSLDRELLDLRALNTGVTNTYTAVSNEASTLLGEMQDFDAVTQGGNLDQLSNNVASFSTDAQAMVDSLDQMITAKAASLETAATSISDSFDTASSSIEDSMASIEMAVSKLPSTETSTIAQLNTLTRNYARSSYSAILTAEQTRAASSNNNLNSFVAARTGAQKQMDLMDSIETAATTAFSGRYTKIFTTSRNLLEGKYGGDTEIDATPDIVKNTSYGYYGRACAATGEYFACSAYRYNAGIIAVYKMDVDTEKVKLLQIISPGGIQYRFAYFGYSMAMDGDLLVAGAYNYAEPLSATRYNYGRGRVYLFKRGTNEQYTMIGNLTAATTNYDNCGFAVAVNAGRFAFSCPGQDSKVGTTTRRDGGNVHIYTVSAANTITYQANVTHTLGGGTFDRLGGALESLSMFGNTLVAGTTGFDDRSSGIKYTAGAAAVFEFEKGAWVEKALLTAPSHQQKAYDYFGSCVVLGNNLMAISAPYHDPNITGSTTSSAGSIWLFARNTTGSWNVVQHLTAENSKAFDYLGFSMDLNDDGTQLIASAHGNDGAGSSAGAVHMFSKASSGTWSRTKTIYHKDATTSDLFGYGASFGKDYYVAGAYGAEDTGSRFGHGKAYAYIDFELFPSA